MRGTDSAERTQAQSLERSNDDATRGRLTYPKAVMRSGGARAWATSATGGWLAVQRAEEAIGRRLFKLDETPRPLGVLSSGLNCWPEAE